MKGNKIPQQGKINKFKNIKPKLKHIIKISLIVGSLLVLTLIVLSYILIHDISRPNELSMPTAVWEPPPCSTNEECQENEHCVDNICKKLGCSELEIGYDHSCMPKQLLTLPNIINKDYGKLKFEVTALLDKKEDISLNLNVARGSRLVLYEVYTNYTTLVHKDYIWPVYIPTTLTMTIGKEYLQKGRNSIFIIFNIKREGSLVENTIHPFEEKNYYIQVYNDSYFFSPNLKATSTRMIGKGSSYRFEEVCIDTDFHDYETRGWCQGKGYGASDGCVKGFLSEKFCHDNECYSETVDCNEYCNMMYGSEGKCKKGVCKC